MKEYLDIGHNDSSILWIYDKHRLLKIPVKLLKDHLEAFPFMNSRHYRGRFDPEKNIITLVNPYDIEPPWYLIEELKNEFGINAKIKEFKT